MWPYNGQSVHLAGPWNKVFSPFFAGFTNRYRIVSLPAVTSEYPTLENRLRSVAGYKSHVILTIFVLLISAIVTA